MPEPAKRPQGRPKGHKLQPEVKERIGLGVSRKRHVMSYQTQEYYRSKIKAGRIISVLCQIAEGAIEGKPNQVLAAQILLRKVLPDLASTEHTLDAAVTLRTIITGVIRASDLEPDSKTIEHLPDPSQEGKP